MSTRGAARPLQRHPHGAQSEKFSYLNVIGARRRGVILRTPTALAARWAWLDRDGLTLHDRFSGTRMMRNSKRSPM